MIEVEKKFTLNNGDEEKLISGAEFISEKTFTDVYYDDKDFSLTRKDIWLRSRDYRYELKVPFNDSLEDRISDQYEELESEAEISNFLNLNKSKNFGEALQEKNYLPFCKITTTRKKYKNGEYIIDIDSLDFGYNITEIELMVPDVSLVREATLKIVAFGKSLGLTEGQVRGKVVEYLRRNNPTHFQALVEAGVIKK